MPAYNPTLLWSLDFFFFCQGCAGPSVVLLHASPTLPSRHLFHPIVFSLSSWTLLLVIPSTRNFHTPAPFYCLVTFAHLFCLIFAELNPEWSSDQLLHCLPTKLPLPWSPPYTLTPWVRCFHIFGRPRPAMLRGNNSQLCTWGSFLVVLSVLGIEESLATCKASIRLSLMLSHWPVLPIW